VLILGGPNDREHFQILQDNINKLIQIGSGASSNNGSHYYKQLLNNIICNNVCFNKLPETESLDEITGADTLIKQKVPYRTILFQNLKPSKRFRNNLRHLQNDYQRSRKLF
jgi:hypothetical protein